MSVKHTAIAIACAALLSLSTSCGQQGVQELGLGGYWYTLPVPKAAFETVGDHGLVWRCNGWELRVDEDEQIYFNGEKYGKMQKGDELSVSWEGKVFLNHKALSPKEAE